MYPCQVWPSNRAERLKALVPTLDVEGILEISAIQALFIVEIAELGVPFFPLFLETITWYYPKFPLLKSGVLDLPGGSR